MTRQEERQHERKGIIFAVIFHAALLLLFFFWIVLKQTNNEAGAGMPGIPINFGFDEMGSGDNNSMDQVATQAAEQQEEQSPAEETVPSAEDALTTENPDAETVVSDTKKPQPTTTTTKPTQTTTQATTATTNAQPGATTKPGVSSGDGVTNKPGNQGNINGTLEAKNYYGTPGNGGNGGNGALNMDGWHLGNEPAVANVNQESGKVTFVIKIDNEGEIVSLTVKEKQISEALVKKCEDEIRNKMEFVKNKNNGSTAEYSTGTISFVFRLN